jgi:hypothetical protein
LARRKRRGFLGGEMDGVEPCAVPMEMLRYASAIITTERQV